MTKAYFDAVADDWASMRESFFPDAVRERALDAAGSLQGKTALDVGAGAGYLTEALLARGATVHAVDESPRMVEVLARRFPAAKARVGSALELPYADASFDVVAANMVLHHVEDPAKALAEWARVLRPGGALVVTDLDAHTHEFLRTEQHDRWLGFDRADVERWLRSAGLAEASVGDAQSSCCSCSATTTDEARVTIFLATGTRPKA